jgi:hypothetical protein
MEVFQEAYSFLNGQLFGTWERDAVVIASEAYLVYKGLRPSAIVHLYPPNDDLHPDLRKILQHHNLLLLSYFKKPGVYMIVPNKTSTLQEYQHLQQIPSTNKNAIDVLTGRMLGYMSPQPLRTVQEVGKQAGEVQIRVGSAVGQIAPQVVPAGLDIQQFLQPIADTLNALYTEAGLEHRAEVVVRPFPLKAGTRKKRKRSRRDPRRVYRQRT